MSRISDRIDLPLDVICGAPMIEMYANRQLVIEGECRISHYDEDMISALCRGRCICVKGKGLNITMMNCDGLIISGSVTSIDFTGA